MNFFFLFYLLLLPWTLYSPFPHLPVKIIWADLFFLPVVCKAGFDYWKAKKTISIFTFDKAAFLFIGVLFLNVIWIEPSLRSILKYVGIVYVVAILVILRMAIPKEEDMTKAFSLWFWLTLLLSVTGIVAYVIAQWQQLPNFFIVKDHAYLGEGRFLWRLWSVGYTPSMLAAYLHMGLISLLWLRVGEQRKSRISFWRVSLLIILLAILLTKSRLLLGTLVSLMIWELFHFRESSKLKQVFIAAFSMLTLLFSVLVIGSLWYKITPASIRFQQPKMEIQWNREPSHYQFRNRLAAALFIEHPILGIGLGKFQSYSETPKEILDRHFPGFFDALPDSWFHRPHDPHSTYQGWAAETGVIGEIALWILLGAFLIYCLRARKEITSMIPMEKQGIFLAGLGGFLVHGLYMDILTLRYFWFLLGCVAVYRSVLK